MSSSRSSSQDSSSDSPLPLSQHNNGSIPMFSPYISYTTSNASRIKAPPQQNISASIPSPPINPYTSNQNMNINPQSIESYFANPNSILITSKTPLNAPPKLGMQIHNENAKCIQISDKMPQQSASNILSEGIKDPSKSNPIISTNKLEYQIPAPQIPLKQQNIPILIPEKTNILDKNLGSSGTDIKNANSQELKPPIFAHPLPFRPNPNTSNFCASIAF
ncbi:hypothetical protein SteCoe_13162 [Stentor coeruleus]|uniref:Uncharacterized protein n=1 Tax=Stentor coeruleus TaxID=5963 RepID=A0A1R2C8Z4_9CILI|nr:hypothetical protein SteCoe_13162 [Stentor coeruleus]